MSFLLDTDLISDSTKPLPSEKAANWRRRHEDGNFFLSVITLGEIEYGIARKVPSRDKRRLEAFLRELVLAFSGRILPIDQAVTSVWGKLRAEAERHGRPLPMVDGLLAATAKFHGLTIATGNTSDFSATGVPLVNPFLD